jgi:peptidoglycan/LPS O-acetylase OafA/YrhL
MKGPETNDDIQVLRAFAILYTLLAHFLPLQKLGFDPKYYCLLTGVDLFFCISGYVITKSLLKEFSGNISFGGGIKGFYIKRCTRLLPSAWLWMFLPLLVQIMLDPSATDLRLSLRDVAEAFLQFANLHNLLGQHFYPAAAPGVFPESAGLVGVYWSLSLEEQFYLIAPFIIFLIYRKRWLWLAGVLLGAALFQLFYNKGTSLWPPDWPTPLWFRCDSIIYGVLIGLSDSWLSRRWTRVRPETRKLAARIIVPLGLLYLALMTSSSTLPFLPYQTGMLAMVCAMIVIAAAANGRALWAPIIGPALIWMGDRSYSIYLVHIPCLFFVLMIMSVLTGVPLHQVYTHPVWQWIAMWSAVVLTGFVAEANFRIIEVPIRNWGRNWAHRVRQDHAAPRNELLAQPFRN